MVHYSYLFLGMRTEQISKLRYSQTGQFHSRYTSLIVLEIVVSGRFVMSGLLQACTIIRHSGHACVVALHSLWLQPLCTICSSLHKSVLLNTDVHLLTIPQSGLKQSDLDFSRLQLQQLLCLSWAGSVATSPLKCTAIGPVLNRPS